MTFAELARRIRCTDADAVTVTIEVAGPDGSRRAKKVLIPKTLERESPSDLLVDTLRTAVGAYERMDRSDP